MYLRENEVNMELDKSIFLAVLNELLEEEGITKAEMFDYTGISKATWYRAIEKADAPDMPDIYQMLSLCDLLKTSMYYLLFRRGPKQSTPGMIDRMADIMEAFGDSRFPEKRNIIDRVAALNHRDALITVKYTIPAIIKSHAAGARLRGEDDTTYLRVLERRPTD